MIRKYPLHTGCTLSNEKPAVLAGLQDLFGVTRTISSIHNGLELWILDFLSQHSFAATVVSKCALVIIRNICVKLQKGRLHDEKERQFFFGK